MFQMIRGRGGGGAFGTTVVVVVTAYPNGYENVRSGSWMMHLPRSGLQP
jgi:hypothetical protein